MDGQQITDTSGEDTVHRRIATKSTIYYESHLEAG